MASPSTQFVDLFHCVPPSRVRQLVHISEQILAAEDILSGYSQKYRSAGSFDRQDGCLYSASVQQKNHCQFSLITSTITPWSSCCFSPLTTTTATTPSTPLTRMGTAPPWMAYRDATSSLMPNLALNAASSPSYLQCWSHVLVPHRSTVLRFRCTQISLSGITPEPVTVWNSTCPLLASAIEMTVAVGMGSRRRRSRFPRTQASSKVKDSSVKESPSCLSASSCAVFLAVMLVVWGMMNEGGRGGGCQAVHSRWPRPGELSYIAWRSGDGPSRRGRLPSLLLGVGASTPDFGG